MFLPWRSGQEADTHVHQSLVQCLSADAAESVPFCTLMPATCGAPREHPVRGSYSPDGWVIFQPGFLFLFSPSVRTIPCWGG